MQQKSEACYITERIFRNAISHILNVSVAHLQLGSPDLRVNSVYRATLGAIKLCKLIKKDNDGMDIKVMLPMFISTIYNIIVCSFEGCVNARVDDIFTIIRRITRVSSHPS